MPLPVALNDILQFKLKGFYNGAAEVNNVFHYKVTADSTATLNEYAAGLWAALNPVLLPRTNDSVTYDQIDAAILDTDGNLVNGETYIIPTGEGVGADGGDSLPPFVCWTFKLIRPDASFRHGFKRFAGVSEAAQADGLPTSGVLSSLAAIAAMLAGTITAYSIDVGGSPDAPISGNVGTPVIVQRVINGDPISPVNLGEVLDAVFDKIGSQNTRKFGRGS